MGRLGIAAGSSLPDAEPPRGATRRERVREALAGAVPALAAAG